MLKSSLKGKKNILDKDVNSLFQLNAFEILTKNYVKILKNTNDCDF